MNVICGKPVEIGTALQNYSCNKLEVSGIIEDNLMGLFHMYKIVCIKFSYVARSRLLFTWCLGFGVLFSLLLNPSILNIHSESCCE